MFNIKRQINTFFNFYSKKKNKSNLPYFQQQFNKHFKLKKKNDKGETIELNFKFSGNYEDDALRFYKFLKKNFDDIVTKQLITEKNLPNVKSNIFSYEIANPNLNDEIMKKYITNEGNYEKIRGKSAVKKIIIHSVKADCVINIYPLDGIIEFMPLNFKKCILFFYRQNVCYEDYGDTNLSNHPQIYINGKLCEVISESSRKAVYNNKVIFNLVTHGDKPQFEVKTPENKNKK